jgi:hypothetical protein
MCRTFSWFWISLSCSDSMQCRPFVGISAVAQVLTVSEDQTWSWGDFARSPRNLIVVPLALVALVDLTGHRIEWAGLPDWLAEEYATWTTWAFSSSPFHIPNEWNDYIVLICVVFSIASASYRRKTDNSFIADLLSFDLSRHRNDPQKPLYLGKSFQEKIDDLAAVITSSAMFVVVVLVAACCFLMFMSFFISINTTTTVSYGKWPLILAVIVGSGPFFAWRWILSIGLLFSLLVLGNGVYLHPSASELIAVLGTSLSHNLFSLGFSG